MWMKTKIKALRSHLVFRLWAMMMTLVLFAIGFMWVVQIGLFEQNYAMASLKDARERTAGIKESLAGEDLGKDPNLLSVLSHGSSELFLINQDGKLLEMYSAGHPVSASDRKEEFFLNHFPSGPEKKRNGISCGRSALPAGSSPRPSCNRLRNGASCNLERREMLSFDSDHADDKNSNGL